MGAQAHVTTPQTPTNGYEEDTMTWLYVDGRNSVPATLSTFSCTGPAGDNNPVNGQHVYYSATDSVSDLSLYWQNDHFTGLRISYYDGTSDTGVANNPNFNGMSNGATLHLNRGEKVTYLEIRAPTGSLIDYINIRTDQGQNVTFGNPNSGGTTSVWKDASLGTGILKGVFGHEGSYLNSVGFIFSQDELGESLTDFDWHVDQSNVMSDQIVALQNITLINSSNVNQSGSLNLSASVSKTDNWSSSEAIKYGQSLKISAGSDFKVVKMGVEVTISFDQTYTTTAGGSSTRTISYTGTAGVTVPPRTKQVARTVVRELKLNVPWAATWTKTFVNGTTSSRRINGVYTGTAYQDFKVVYDPPIALPDSTPQTDMLSMTYTPLQSLS